MKFNPSEDITQKDFNDLARMSKSRAVRVAFKEVRPNHLTVIGLTWNQTKPTVREIY